MKKPKTETEKLIEKQQITSGQINAFSGKIENQNILDDYENILIECENAYFTDVLTKTTIDLLLAPIQQANYQIIIKNKTNLMQIKAKEFIEDTLNNLIDGFQYVKNHALFSIITGSQFFEIVWEVRKWNDILCNKIIRLVPIKNENIINYLYNSKGDFVGLEILDAQKNKIELYQDNLFYIIHNQYFGDVRGNSEIRTIIPLVKMKRALLKHSERTIARGVGVPIAYATENFDSSNIEQYKNVLRTIANTDGSYALVGKQDIDRIEFLTVNQSNTMPLLEFLNRDIFFNTLTQFLTTGLGQNGARATAEELKSPYMLKIATIINEVESYFQWLCNIIIDNSSLKLTLDKKDYPQFKLTAITEIDTQKLAGTLSTLAGLGLKLSNDDLKYIRQLLQLPESENKEQEGKLTNHNHELRQNKINDFEVFEYEAVKNLFEQTEKQLQSYFDELVRKIAIDIYIAKKTGKEIDLNEIYYKLYDDLTDKTKLVKQEALKITEKELNKLNYKLARKSKQIQLSYAFIDPVLKFILRIIDSIQLETFEEFDDYTKIENKINENIKNEKREIITLIENEITNTRAELFKEANIKQFRYTTVLDDNVCEVCNPLHDTIMTQADIELAGLSMTAPVNPNCLGLLRAGGHCRCQLIPVK